MSHEALMSDDFGVRWNNVIVFRFFPLLTLLSLQGAGTVDPFMTPTKRKKQFKIYYPGEPLEVSRRVFAHLSLH